MKKCTNCGFYNPDDANCCGKCGKSINRSWYEMIGNREGKDRWKVYDSDTYTCITRHRYNELIDAEKESKLPIWEKSLRIIKDFFNKYSDFDNWNTATQSIFWIVLAIIVGLFFFFILINCSGKKISRIEVNGKYGIGYSKDELLVKAEYDSISSSADGNYWILYDKTNELEGLAYVKDSTVNIIEPKYKSVYRGEGHFAFLKSSENKYDYEFLSYDGVIYNDEPYLSLKYVGSIDNPSLFVAEKGYQQISLIKPDLKPLPDTFKSIQTTAADSVIVATLANSGWPSLSVIYDFKGNRLNNTDLYEVKEFSDGVAWGFASVTDYKYDIWSLFNRQGINIFTFKGKKYKTPVSFSEGIGWIMRYGKEKWSAIDKTGKELFNIEAYDVHPFTMGVAPVYKGTSYYDKKMGFVNKQGETVIPFKYKAKYYNPHFDTDSLIEVKLDGVEGKLHRNGKFTPNSQTK